MSEMQTLNLYVTIIAVYEWTVAHFTCEAQNSNKKSLIHSKTTNFKMVN